VRRAAWSIGAVLLLTSLAACTTGGKGKSSCGTPTPLTAGDAATKPSPGWYIPTQIGGATVGVNDSYKAPTGFGCNAVVMTTGNSIADHVQVLTYAKAGSSLASITNLSYWTYRAAPANGAAPDIALNVEVFGPPGPGFASACTTGTCYSTLVFEPYNQSGGNAAIHNGVWQHWDAINAGNGVWWSSKAQGSGSQGSPLSWTAMQSLYPGAVIGGYGPNLGSYNPNTVAATDGLTFNTTTTNF
jgi:hypothetical protein